VDEDGDEEEEREKAEEEGAAECVWRHISNAVVRWLRPTPNIKVKGKCRTLCISLAQNEKRYNRCALEILAPLLLLLLVGVRSPRAPPRWKPPRWRHVLQELSGSSRSVVRPCCR